jgi:glycosyltransferase involved in cell wall biosynthesis
VSPHRSEGFGLTIASAMHYGKPVIVTGYSGNIDFTDASNAFLIDYKLTALEDDAGEYKKNFVWAEPSTSHLSRLLREVKDHPEEARARGARGQETVRRLLNRWAVEEAIRRRLEPYLPAGC